jgi:hypothetical protein
MRTIRAEEGTGPTTDDPTAKKNAKQPTDGEHGLKSTPIQILDFCLSRAWTDKGPAGWLALCLSHGGTDENEPLGAVKFTTPICKSMFTTTTTTTDNVD